MMKLIKWIESKSWLTILSMVWLIIMLALALTYATTLTIIIISFFITIFAIARVAFEVFE